MTNLQVQVDIGNEYRPIIKDDINQIILNISLYSWQTIIENTLVSTANNHNKI